MRPKCFQTGFCQKVFSFAEEDPSHCWRSCHTLRVGLLLSNLENWLVLRMSVRYQRTNKGWKNKRKTLASWWPYLQLFPFVFLHLAVSEVSDYLRVLSQGLSERTGTDMIIITTELLLHMTYHLSFHTLLYLSLYLFSL